MGMTNTTNNTANKVTINGKAWRVGPGVIPADAKFDGFRQALRDRGIADYVNAMPPRSRKSYKQIFLMLDGTAQVADSRTVCEASRECRSLA